MIPVAVNWVWRTSIKEIRREKAPRVEERSLRQRLTLSTLGESQNRRTPGACGVDCTPWPAGRQAEPGCLAPPAACL